MYFLILQRKGGFCFFSQLFDSTYHVFAFHYLWGSSQACIGTMTPSVVNRIQKQIPERQQRFPHLVTEEREPWVSLLPSQLPSLKLLFPRTLPHSTGAIWPPDLEHPGCTLLGRTPISHPYLSKIQVCWFGNKAKQSSLEPDPNPPPLPFSILRRFLRSGLSSSANGLQLFKWNSPSKGLGVVYFLTFSNLKRCI